MALKLTGDPRLVPGVGAAVRHFADRAGLDARAQADFSAAAEEACRETFPLLATADATIVVTVESLSDRLEVTLEHESQPAPTAGLQTFAILESETLPASGPAGSRLLKRVDRVLSSSQGGVSRTKLVKFLIEPPKQ